MERSGNVSSALAGDLSRRRFIQGGLAAAAAAAVGCRAVPFGAVEDAAAAEIPQVALGKTGARISALGLGTACLGHKNDNKPEVAELIAVFSEAIDRGITYVDTGRIYGRAEEALAEVLRTRRDKVFLATKVWANTAEEARRSFEQSLKTLGIDHADLLHLHSTGDKDIDKVLGEGGSWSYMLDQKKAGKARFLGLTGHSRPKNFVRMIEESKTVDAIMVAMNFVDYHVYGFEEKVLPVARKHEVGVIAMKVYGGIQGSFPNYKARNPFPSQMASDLHRDAIRYARSLEGVSAMVIGVHTAEQLRRNIELFHEAKPFSKEELAAIRARGEPLAREWGPRFGPVA